MIASYGFNRTTIYKWINAAAKDGEEALRSTPATGRPRSLTPAQEQQVFRWVTGRDPRQYGLDFGLWTRAIVVQLIEQKFGIKLRLTAVSKLLAKLGLTPQKPLQRQSISAASAVSAKGGFWFCTYAGALNAELFVVLFRKMMCHRKRPVHLVLDGLPTHKKACVRE